MPYHTAAKKLLTGALVFSLITGSGFAIPESIQAAALTTPFTDVKAGHWSEKHVAKLYYQGIVNGYADGGVITFKPDQSISQQEAVLMTLRFAGMLDSAPSSADADFPSTFQVSSFYKPYIKLAFEKGLLDQQEEYAIAAANAKQAWGSKTATREWMTKLIIKAIDEEDEAKRLQNAATVFTDQDQFDAKYAGYIKAASGLGLVKGVSADKFSPKGNMTRASLATILSRAQSQFPVDYAGQTNGIVTKITDTSIAMITGNKETVYTTDSNTVYYHYNTETPIARNELLLYGDATVIVKDGKAAYVEVMGSKQHMTTMTGTLGKVVEAEKSLYIWNNNAYEKIAYDETTEVVDTNGLAVKLSELKTDTQISVIQDTFRAEPKALKIVAAAQATKTSASGVFSGISNNELITIKDGSTLVTKFLANKVTVEINGVIDPVLDDLLVGADEVTLTLDSSDKVTHIKVTNRVVTTMSDAKIASFVAASKLLTITDANGSRPAALLFTDRTKIYYNDKLVELNAISYLLTQNQKVSISYTGDSIVSISFTTKYTGELAAVNTTKKTIELKLANGTTVSLPYNTTPAVEIAEKASSALTDLVAGEKLTVELNNARDYVATIKAHRSIQYEVVSVQSIGEKLRVANSSTAAFDLSVYGAELLSESGAAIKVDAVKTGNFVNVNYVGKTAATVQIVTPTVGKVIALASNSVTVQDMTGKSVVFLENDGFVITKGTVKSTVTSALSVGDYVEVTKDGANRTMINAAVPETRTFTTYSSTSNQVWTAILYDGDNRNYFYLTDTTKVLHNGAAISVNTLKSGDTIVVFAFRNIAVEIVKQ